MGSLAGFYNCTFADGFQVTGVLTVKPRPQLNLKPLSRTVGCEADVVSMVKLECCVQSPYEVQLNDTTLTVQETIQLGTGARGYISLAYGARLK